MNSIEFNKLVETAKKASHFSDAYIQSMMWANRNQDTSLEDIRLAINHARGEENKTDTKTLLYYLTSNIEFLKAEQELKAAASKLIDLQKRMEQRYMLSPQQSTEVLTQMCEGVKTGLFTKLYTCAILG